MTTPLILHVVTEAVKAAKIKDPQFLESDLITKRYSSLLKQLAESVISEKDVTEEFDKEFTVVSRLICKFADISNTLSWEEFEKQNSLQQHLAD